MNWKRILKLAWEISPGMLVVRAHRHGMAARQRKLAENEQLENELARLRALESKVGIK